MPRKRPHDRLDRIADSATQVFINHGFAGARISQVASLAKVGPGTIYLYASGKEALFDLAIRRSLEDPTVWSLALPHPTPAPGAVADALWRCLQNAAHFPQLWLAADSPPPDNVPKEVEGIVREFYTWLHRYRRAIQLVERCAGDWPHAAPLFYRRLSRARARGARGSFTPGCIDTGGRFSWWSAAPAIGPTWPSSSTGASGGAGRGGSPSTSGAASPKACFRTGATHSPRLTS